MDGCHRSAGVHRLSIASWREVAGRGPSYFREGQTGGALKHNTTMPQPPPGRLSYANVRIAPPLQSSVH